MIRINLLPVRQMKKKTQALRLLFLSGVAIVATVVVLSLATGFFVTKISGLQETNKNLTARKKELDKTLKLIKKLERQKKLVDQQTGVVNKLKNKSQLTVRILNDVADKTPHERMWLTSFAQDPNSLKLSGMALDNRTIAAYMEELKGSPYLENVTLDNSSLSNYGGRNLQKFSLTCSIKKLPEAADEAAKDNGKK